METYTKQTTEFVKYFVSKLYELNPHAFIASQQSMFLNHSKENLQANEYIVILDFSENYSFVIQDEIQGWHWANSQCTIHPYVIYFKDNENVLQYCSLIMIAESLKHNFTAVHLFQERLFNFLLNRYGTIKKVLFFSDGAGSQYKNKYNFFYLCQLKKLYGCDAEWHFFATSHGKGPCDGIGGTLKRLATKASLQRTHNNHILSAKSLYDWAKNNHSIMHYEFCSLNDYNKHYKALEKKTKKIKTIEGTQSFHAFIPFNDRSIKVKTYSFSNQERIKKLL